MLNVLNGERKAERGPEETLQFLGKFANISSYHFAFLERGAAILVIHESAEDYLESILILQERRGQVRSIDIVNELGYSKPSVSIAMKKLRENGYISMEPDGRITLNESGLAIANRIYDRHKTITRFFMLLGVSEDVATEDACKVEHDISDETFEKIRQFVNASEA